MYLLKMGDGKVMLFMAVGVLYMSAGLWTGAEIEGCRDGGWWEGCFCHWLLSTCRTMMGYGGGRIQRW